MLNYETLPFDKCIEKIEYKKKIKKKKYLKNGKFPIVSQEDQLISGFWNNIEDVYKIDKPVIIFGDHTRILKYIDFDFVVGADGTKILKTKSNIISKYFYYFLLSTNIKSLGYSRHYKLLKKLKLNLPPMSIQQKIVAKLDKIFAEIDKATAVVEINTRKIDVFFQSYLEKIYNNKYFAKKKISKIAKIKGGKRIPKGFNLKTEKTPYVYLRVKSFTENGEIDNSELRYVDAEVKNLIKNYVINSEDLYISIAGTIGKTGIVSKQLSGSLLTENACRLVFEKNINNKFVYYFTKSPSFKSQVIEQTRTTAQPKLALNRLGNIELIIPSLKEQLRIVESLDRMSFFLTSSKNKYFSKINELRKLKQAILQQAFNGELVKAA